jgi:hypothetical protein
MFLGVRARPVHIADNFTAICEPIVSLDNVGSSTSHNPVFLYYLLRRYLYFFIR